MTLDKWLEDALARTYDGIGEIESLEQYFHLVLTVIANATDMLHGIERKKSDPAAALLLCLTTLIRSVAGSFQELPDIDWPRRQRALLINYNQVAKLALSLAVQMKTS